ncbi:MAG: hypothetical protein ACE5FH_00885 [Candidatus Zixiibacteriota bacterium]
MMFRVARSICPYFILAVSVTIASCFAPPEVRGAQVARPPSHIVDFTSLAQNTTAQSTAATNSPFGFHPAGVFLPGYPDNGYIDAQQIGVTWTRQGVYAFWFLVQPDTSVPVYDFTLYDQQWSTVPDDMNILANISPAPAASLGYTMPGSYLPIDSAKYCDFVKATIERYDGDGLADMPGLTNPVKYWQVGNEPNDAVTSDFAALQSMTYIAIKDACADCQVLIGGVSGLPLDYIPLFDSNFAPILTELAGQYVDIMDFHWYGTATGEYRGVDAAYNHIRDTMTALGFSPDLPFWITEMGAYSGDPLDFGPLIFPYQSEQQQAADYVKRYIHPLSFGVGKVFCAFGLVEGFKHDNGYFDHTGLIYDGLDSDDLGLGCKKLGYFAYKKMTETLEGANWDSTQVIATGVSDVYAYRFVRNDSSIFVAWWDYFNDPGYIAGDSIQFTLSGLNFDTALITDAVPYDTFATSFVTIERPVIATSVIVALKEIPVYVKAAATDNSCCIGTRGDINGDGNDLDIVDLTTVVDYLFGVTPIIPCAEESDVNGDGSGLPDIVDLTFIVDWLFGVAPTLAPCP